MASLTFATALRTPLPPYRAGSPSLNSRASRSPVDAPEGTAARPNAPPSSVTSTSTVGLPRESRISRACTWVIFTVVSLREGASSSSGAAAAPVGIRFVAQGVFAQRSNQWFVIRRDDDDARVGDGVPASIFVEVVANQRSAWNKHVAIDDRSADARMTADAHPRHQDA